MKAVVGGMFVSRPGQGGATWAAAQYVLALESLGFQVLALDWMPPGHESNVRAVEQYRSLVAEFFGWTDNLVVASAAGTSLGLDRHRLDAFLSCADVLINLSGVVPLDGPAGDVQTWVYVDLDPAFNELWHDAEGVDRNFHGHTHHATVGLGLAAGVAPIPDCDIRWLPVLPPVDLHRWPVAAGDGAAITTVGNWRSYGSIHHGGVHYGQRAHTVRTLIDLPRRSSSRVEVAFDIHPDESEDLTRLQSGGWTLLPPEVAGTPERFLAFVQGSQAELSVPKSGYVISRSGWFSDRSASYLASGRPVIALDTGFSDHVPCGAGIVPFQTLDEAIDRIQAVRADYSTHREAARSWAEAHLDGELVMSELLNRCDVR